MRIKKLGLVNQGTGSTFCALGDRGLVNVQWHRVDVRGQGVVRRAGPYQEATPDRQGEGRMPWIVICIIPARINPTYSGGWRCQPDSVLHGISVARTSCQDLLI